MATRKDRIRQRFIDVIQPQLDVGETVIASSRAQTGPSPWLEYVLFVVFVTVIVAVGGEFLIGAALSALVVLACAAVGAVVVLPMRLLGMREYFLAVTDRRVFLVGASAILDRPTGVKFAGPRSAVSIASVKRGTKWSRVAYCQSGAKPLTMRFYPTWYEDMEAIVYTTTAETPP